jgi:hypothetical protein
MLSHYHTNNFNWVVMYLNTYNILSINANYSKLLQYKFLHLFLRLSSPLSNWMFHFSFSIKLSQCIIKLITFP